MNAEIIAKLSAVMDAERQQDDKLVEEEPESRSNDVPVETVPTAAAKTPKTPKKSKKRKRPKQDRRSVLRPNNAYDKDFHHDFHDNRKKRLNEEKKREKNKKNIINEKNFFECILE